MQERTGTRPEQQQMISESWDRDRGKGRGGDNKTYAISIGN